MLVEGDAMTRFSAALLLIACTSSAALAQDDAPPAPPPLVSLEDTAQPTPAQPSTPGPLAPPAIANRPYDEVVAAEAARQEEPPGRPLRILTGLLFGAGVGAAGAVVGGLAGSAALPDQPLQPVGAAWTGAAIGFGLTAPLGVLLSGWLFDGDGSGWATLIGDVLGASVGVAAVLLGGQDGKPLLFALPLVGAIVGYEITSPSARSLVRVSATFAPTRDGGGVVGLSGRF